MTSFIVIVIFGIAFFVQILYYLVIYSRIAFYRPKRFLKPVKSQQAVSVVICARNEALNLKRFLPSVLNQDYPDYEVIVVNDCSSDNSQEILSKLKEKYPHLRIIKHPPIQSFLLTGQSCQRTILPTPSYRGDYTPLPTYATHNKKIALTAGIEAAKNELILLTDADCYAESNKWISSMLQNFTDNTEIVLGYGGYIRKNGFFNKLIRYDTLFIALQYFSFALVGLPYMGIGRNLAYRKSLFITNKGFTSHIDMASGDDDLFVNEVAKKVNTTIELHNQSHTRSEPKTSFKEWLHQKRRHLTTGKYYKTKHKILLAGEVLSRIIYYLLFFLLLIFNNFIEFVLFAFIFRLLIQIFIFKITMKHLNEKKLLLLSPIFDIILPFIYLSIGNIFSNFTTKKNKWK